MRADLALVGFGNVGRRFAGLVSEVRSRLVDQWDLDCRIVAIVTRRHGGACRLSGIDASRAAHVLDETESLEGLHDTSAGPAPRTGFDAIRVAAQSTAPLRVLVETTTLNIHDGQPAVDHVRAALSAGLHVVTANKGPAAFAYRELQSLAEAARLSFLFEGAVMDGIPIFNLVREALPAVTVLGFRGVVNATTNHILTALEDGEEFAPALRRMQAEGIAEADASLDVDGWDAAAKAAALANVLMDAGITPHTVRRAGIGPQSAAQARQARGSGRRLRLVATGHRGEAPVVGPTELPEGDLLAGLRGTANALVLETDLLGRVAIAQLDSGLTQTAYALLTDLVAIRRRAARHEAPARRTP
jgi:homoserine dehydrogenase